MKLGEVVVTHVYHNFTKFHQNRMKTKKVQTFKVSVKLWKLYIVQDLLLTYTPNCWSYSRLILITTSSSTSNYRLRWTSTILWLWVPCEIFAFILNGYTICRTKHLEKNLFELVAKNAIDYQIDTGVECHQKIRSIVKGI